MRTMLFIILIIVGSRCHAQETMTINDELKIIRLSERVLIHVSVLQSETFGRVEANGLIYISGNEAVIMDTPATDKQSQELLDWLNANYQNIKIKAIIVNHFHSDCLGGLKTFHNRGIESWSHKLTPELLKMNKDTFDVPKKTFDTTVTLLVGGKKVECFYPGEAHTRDNIVSWIEDEKIIFGGCMVKSMNAGKGNVADANVAEWSRTIERVANKFQQVRIVVPGHGAHGGMELLEFTARLFR